MGHIELGEGTGKKSLWKNIQNILMWILVFPMLFRKINYVFEKTRAMILSQNLLLDAVLNYLERISEKLNTSLKWENVHASIFDKETKKIEELLNLVNNKPSHNLTAYMKLDGSIYNLNLFKTLGFDVEYEPGVGDNGVIAFKLSGDKKDLDLFRIDLTKFDPNHEKKPVFDLGRVLLKKREFDRGRVAALATRNLFVLMATYGRLTHNQLFNMCVHSQLEYLEQVYAKETKPEEANKPNGNGMAVEQAETAGQLVN